MCQFFSRITKISFLLILSSIVLLIIFKLVNFGGNIAAYIVGISALVGGILLIIGSVGLFFDGSLPRNKDDALVFHLPELVAVGVVFIFAAIIILSGKIIK